MKKKSIILIIGIILAIYIAVLVSSCSSTSVVSSEQSGAQLWGNNCLRCHNAPSPTTLSDVEWEVAVAHMRIRANLTEDEAEKISEFLKTAN